MGRYCARPWSRKSPAFSTVDFAGKDALARGVAILPSLQFVLHPLEGGWRDDGIVILFHIELRDFPVVFEPVLAQKIDAVGFLKELIAHVGFVRQNPPNGRVAPFCLARRGGNALSRQRLCDLERGVSRKEITEDATDDGGLGGIDDQPSVLALVVAEKVLVVEAVLAVRELLPLPPTDVFADAPALLLCE